MRCKHFNCKLSVILYDNMFVDSAYCTLYNVHCTLYLYCIHYHNTVHGNSKVLQKIAKWSQHIVCDSIGYSE